MNCDVKGDMRLKGKVGDGCADWMNTFQQTCASVILAVVSKKGLRREGGAYWEV